MSLHSVLESHYNIVAVLLIVVDKSEPRVRRHRLDDALATTVANCFKNNNRKKKIRCKRPKITITQNVHIF